MKKLVITMLLAIFTLSLASCADSPYSKGQQGVGIGAAGGALIGQAIGRNTEATLIGAAVGTLLGYIVGNEMDKFDRQQLNQAYEYTPSGQATSWRNPDTGNTYEFTPQPAYTPPNRPQQVCRQAEILATIDGRAEKTFTTACRNNQTGQWEIRN
jgi:surface antigen